MNVNEIILSTMDEPAEDVRVMIGAGDVETVLTKRATILKFLQSNVWDEKEYKLWLLNGGAKKLPPKTEMVGNVVEAALTAIKKPIKKVSQEEQERRLSICKECVFFKEDSFQCGECGCFVKFKALLEFWHCRIGKW